MALQVSGLLAALPVVCWIFFTAGVFVCYAVGLSYQHYLPPPFWPYVSDVGTTPPESCIFSFVTVSAGIGASISNILFYKYVEAKGFHSRVNTAGLILGQTAFVGTIFVGCFQWTKVLYPHIFGAVLVCAGLAFYSWTVAVITWRDLRKFHPKWLIALRLALMALITITSVLFLIFFNLRKRSDLFFKFNVVAEWIAILLGVLMIATLGADLKNITWIHIAVKTSLTENESKNNDCEVISNEICKMPKASNSDGHITFGDMQRGGLFHSGCYLTGVTHINVE